MYTNIETEHALTSLKEFFQKHPICCNLYWEPIHEALTIIMTHNVVQFSDKYYLQLCGTAMGTPPAPIYATLYFGIHEVETLLPRHHSNLLLLKRYIDDMFGVWVVV